jgi:ADP-ribose pyrophosphatase YjhB (NUDIX family)
VDGYPRHIVAAAALVANGSGEVLLVRTRNRGWVLPGGQIEEGEGLLDGLGREILEETGVTVRIGPLAGVYSNIKPPTKLLLGFLSDYESGTLQTSPETLDVAWVRRERAAEFVTNEAERDRVLDMITFDGAVTYRVYSTKPYVVHEQSSLGRFNKPVQPTAFGGG